jgi:uncharacterized membrane-anchored protein
MRKRIVLLTGFAVLALTNYSIYRKEQLLANGRVVLLELVPVDPRSLMQGDYMALRFHLQNDVSRSAALRDGSMVVALDNRGIAVFRRLDHGAPLASGEFRLRYRVRASQVKLGTGAFFFQEGQQQFYQTAHYAEARIDDSGEMLLTGLRGPGLEKLGPP